MERKQKGERFKVLDQAKIPERPFKPNRPKIILFGVFLVMAAGGGLAGLIEYLDHSFYKIDIIQNSLAEKNYLNYKCITLRGKDHYRGQSGYCLCSNT